MTSAPHGQRRIKIYCDKWVHEGVCAFTQQGCKYKHEMPADKLTQHQLGLFHGYPQWWKKHQSDLARQREAPPPSSENPKNRGPGIESRFSSGNNNNERYMGRSGHSTMGSGSGQLAWRHSGEYGGSSESQVLGQAVPSSFVGRTTTTSRGASGAMRTPICMQSFQTPIPLVVSPSDSTLLGILIYRLHSLTHVSHTATSPDNNNLSPCPVSYGSPYGPIAPPARSTTATATTLPGNARAVSASAAQPGNILESQSREEDIFRLPLRARTRTVTMPPTSTSSPMLPTSNPYASLEALDNDSGSGARLV